MRPASSSSSPSPSPSSWNVLENISCRNEGATTGCISRILRRLLCFNSLPLCSFDHFKEDKKESSVIIGGSASTPGLVARLMGLDSLPRIEPIEESLLTSSVDSFMKLRSSPQEKRQRNIPAYQELEDENFFILSFEKGGSRHESHVEGRKLVKNSLKLERSVRCSKCKKKNTRRTLQGKNQENGEENMISEGNMDCGIRDGFQAENQGNVLHPPKNPCQIPEKTKTKKVNGDSSMAAAISFEAEGNSENSSPNSVLEFVEFSTDEESAYSGEISRLANSKMRRPSSNDLENFGNSRERNFINNGDGKKEKLSSRLRNRYQDHAEKWDEIRELVATEMTKSSWLDDEI